MNKLRIDLSNIQFSGLLRDRGYDQSFNTRYIIASKIVEEIKHVINGKTNRKLKVLDLGGYNGAARELLNDKVTILDVFEDSKLEDYIRVDNVGIPRPDDSFDIVISTDVLEHIQGEDRTKFIDEALRVAKYAVVILAPFDHHDGQVTREELFADSVYEGETGEEYIWLKEHREYGLPKRKWIESILEKRNLAYSRISHTSLRLWGTLTVNSFFFANNIYQADKRLGNVLKKMNEEYFNEVAPVDFPDDGYRSVYVISKHFKKIEIVIPDYNESKVDKFIALSNIHIGKVFAKMSELIFMKSVELKNYKLVSDEKTKQLEELTTKYNRITQSMPFKAIRIVKRTGHKILK